MSKCKQGHFRGRGNEKWYHLIDRAFNWNLVSKFSLPQVKNQMNLLTSGAYNNKVHYKNGNIINPNARILNATKLMLPPNTNVRLNRCVLMLCIE